MAAQPQFRLGPVLQRLQAQLFKPGDEPITQHLRGHVQYGVPRHSSSARAAVADASGHRPPRRAAPASRHAASKPSTSSSGSATAIRYPGAEALIRAPARGPSACRSRRTWLRNVVAAPGGGDPSHTASARASQETGTSADSSRASRARCRAPGTATAVPVPSATSSVPSNANRTPLTCASLSPLPQRWIRPFHADRTHVARRRNQNSTEKPRPAPMLAHGTLPPA